MPDTLGCRLMLRSSQVMSNCPYYLHVDRPCNADIDRVR